MTKETRSFKPIADYLHAKGLKFGLHLMRGIPRQAVDTNNTAILGTSYKATDIVDKAHSCFWNRDMYGVDMSKPGAQEYYDSVFALMASWDLDFVKVDDLAGHPPAIEATTRRSMPLASRTSITNPLAPRTNGRRGGAACMSSPRSCSARRSESVTVCHQPH
jgi:hypothetical protein